MTHIVTHKANLLLYLILLIIYLPPFARAEDDDILDMDLSSLMEVQITSAGRKAQALSDVPAAVYVIDHKKIKQSGATSLPEALRLVPGLHVARINANRWAISSRGFNGQFSNKLLVQIDGRSVYTPSFSGVYWNMQNLLLEDVERIEVIRGPGATLWGANAVNGIINVITRPASDTQGKVISLGSGNHEKQMAGARVGTKLNANTYARIYAMHNGRDSFVNAEDGSDGNDEWHNSQIGFRIDGDRDSRHSWTFQGDLYRGDSDQDVVFYLKPDYPYYFSTVDQVISEGGNLLARWTHKRSRRETLTVQAYYDYTTREEFSLDQTHHTFDMDLQHRFQPAGGHDLVWGIGFRTVQDDFDNTFQVAITTDSDTTHLFSGFVQDEITLVDNTLWLTLGTKLEHNDSTGVEIQPNARLLWKPQTRHSFWASVSRAVRTPSRMETSGKILQAVVPFPVYTEISLSGTQEYGSEKLIAWEAGYRYAPAVDFSVDLSFFYNDYTDLQGLVSESDSNTSYFANNMKGHTYGLEASVQWTPLKWLETELTLSTLKMDIEGDDFSKRMLIDTSPSCQTALRVGVDLHETVRLNLWTRYISKVQYINYSESGTTWMIIDDRISLDVNVQWQLNEALELMIAGQNLLDGEHMEFAANTYLATTDIERSIYAKITWRF